MEKVIFEDDMKEFRRRCIWLLVIAVLHTVLVRCCRTLRDLQS